MLNLIRSELFKLFKSKAFYICMAVGCVLIAVSAATMQLTSILFQNSPEMVSSVTQQMEEMGGASGSKMGVGTSDIGLMIRPTMEKFLQTCLSDNSVQVVLAVFLSIFIASEFHHGTIKNLCCRGQSRVKIYFGKLFAGSLAGILISLAAVAVAFLLGGALWGFEVSAGFWPHLLRMLALELYLTVALCAVFTGVAMAVRNTGGSIAINICLIVFATMIFMLVNLIIGDNATLQNYWIITNFSLVNSFEPAKGAILRALGVGAAYFAAFTGLGLLSLQKRDV